MVEVRLHGPLATQFGAHWDLDISTPLEAVSAIECARPGFRQAIADLAEKGMVFRVRTKNHDYGEEDIAMRLGSQRRVDIVPLVLGASAGVRFVIGAVLIATSVMFLGGPTNPLGAAVFATGTSLVLGAVTEWLTPNIKRDDTPSGLQSWGISGPTNTADQGSPVPVIYGEVLTGGYPISAGLTSSAYGSDAAATSTATIGGESDFSVSLATSDSGVVTASISLSVSTAYIDEDVTYSWSYSGFPGSQAVRLVRGNTDSVILEVDYVIGTVLTSAFFESYGNLAVTVNGYYRSAYTQVGGRSARSASTNRQVRVYLQRPFEGA